jgi:hypothetical protein
MIWEDSVKFNIRALYKNEFLKKGRCFTGARRVPKIVVTVKHLLEETLSSLRGIFCSCLFLSVCLSVFLSFFLSLSYVFFVCYLLYMFYWFFVRLFVHLSVCLFVHLLVCSIFLQSVYRWENYIKMGFTVSLLKSGVNRQTDTFLEFCNVIRHINDLLFLISTFQQILH